MSTQNITADLGLCQGYGNCLVNAPGYFDLSDDGKVAVLRESVADADLLEVADAVSSCPVRALKLAATA